MQRSELAGLLGEDRTALLGALMSLVDQLGSGAREQLVAAWRDRGQRALEAGSTTEPSATEP